MTQPFRFIDAPTLLGSWPVVPDFVGGGTVVMPRTLLSQATILGSRQETVAGFNVSGKGFLLFIDGVQKNIAFVAPDPLNLDTVINEINAAVAPDPPVAFRDNGFLRLESATIGEGSTLRVETDNNPEIFLELGLFAGVSSRAGDITPSASMDPDRQIAVHGQLTMMDGENLEARVVNRVAMQVAINSDIQHGVLSRKRVAKVAKTTVNNPGSGFTLTGDIYTGPDASPTISQLENIVTLLDSNGNELFYTEWYPDPPDNAVFIYDTETNRQRVQLGAAPFLVTDPENEVFVQVDDGTIGALNGVPLKVIDYVSAGEVIVANVDANGNEVEVNNSFAGTAYRNTLQKNHVKVNGLWTSAGMTQRVEQYEFTKLSTLTIDRVENNNRIVCGVGGFLANSAVGDVVEITGHGVTFPFTNDGVYRISDIVDDVTIELVTEDYGPVILNPSGLLGTADVRTDGNFWTNPYVSLNASGIDGTFTVVHKIQSNLNDIIDDPGAISGGLIEHMQEVDSTVLSTISAIIGPSYTLDSYLYSDRRYSLEDIYFQFSQEHDRITGRHTDVKSDSLYVGALLDEPRVHRAQVHHTTVANHQPWDSPCLALRDDRNQTTGVGGGIIFEGHYTDAGDWAAFGGIRGHKRDSTSGWFFASLDIWARGDGIRLRGEQPLDIDSFVPHVHIKSDGDVDFAEGVKIASAVTADAGRMQYDGGEHEGHDGTSWKILGVPPKGIVAFNISGATITSDFSGNGLGNTGSDYYGWAICNGNNGTPDLQGRFVRAPNTWTTGAGTTGGSDTMAHTHSLSNHTHQGAAHTHSITHNHAAFTSGGSSAANTGSTTPGATGSSGTGNTGGASTTSTSTHSGHTHGDGTLVAAVQLINPTQAGQSIFWHSYNGTDWASTYRGNFSYGSDGSVRSTGAEVFGTTATGGSHSHTHSHTHTGPSHTHTSAAHTHTITHTHSIDAPSHSGTSGARSASTSGGPSNNTSGAASNTENRPAYHELVHLMRL